MSYYQGLDQSMGLTKERMNKKSIPGGGWQEI